MSWLRSGHVEPGPLPPHERSWRHPSELGPPAHEPTTTGGRVLILSTATLGLLLVGVLALSMTPRRSGSPATANSTLSSFRAASASLTSVSQPVLPLVTPVGDDGWGVTTADALAGASGQFVQVRLPTGEIIEVEVVGRDGDLALVSLPPDSEAEPYELATATPRPTDTVVVGTDQQLVVTMDELAHVDVDEATPVLDDDGRLIGLCTGERDARWVMPVDTLPTDPTTTSTSPSTSQPIRTSTTSAVIVAPSTSPTTARPTTPSTVAPTTPVTSTPTSTTRPMTTSTTASTSSTTTTTIKPAGGATDGSD